MLLVWLLALALPAAADSGDEPKPIPLGDVPADESTPSEEPASGATPSSDDVDGQPDYFADRDNKEGISTVRGTFSLGPQLALASDSLEPSTGSFGGGGRLNVAFAPPTWPVLFGASLELVGYGSSSVIYEQGGRLYDAELEQLSHVGQAFVRLQPERYAFRPYIDLTGGYWVIIFNQKLEDSVDDDSIKTVRAGATGCYGVGVGIDWLFGNWGPWGNYGVGFDVRYTRGISLPVPDLRRRLLKMGS